MDENLYTHVMWGGVFNIDIVKNTLISVVDPPDEWKLMQRMGWGVGKDVLAGDLGLTEHFCCLERGNLAHGEAQFHFVDGRPFTGTEHGRYKPTW